MRSLQLITTGTTCALWLLGACSGDDDAGDSPDAGILDAGLPDASSPDAAPPDAAIPTPPEPGVQVAFPPATSLTRSASLHVRGTAFDENGITALRVAGVDATSTDGFATWSAHVPLASGVNSLSVGYDDGLGGQHDDVARVEVENAPMRYEEIQSLAWHDSADSVLVLDLHRGLIAQNLATGDRRVVSSQSVGSGPHLYQELDVQWNPTHGHALVLQGDHTASNILAVDIATGARTLVTGATGGSDPVGSGPDLPRAQAIAWDPVGARALVLATHPDNGIYAVDVATGARSIVTDGVSGAGPALAVVRDILWDISGGRILVSDSLLDAIVAIDATTGARTIVSDASRGTGPALDYPTWLSWDPDNGRLLVADLSQDLLFAVDPGSGDRTVLGDLNDAYDGAYPRRGFVWDPVQSRAVIANRRRRDPEVMSWNLVADPEFLYDYHTGAGPALVPGCMRRATAWDADNRRALYLDACTGQIVSVALDTGERSVLVDAGVGKGPAFGDVYSIVWDVDGNRLFAFVESPFRALYKIDLITGYRSLIHEFSPACGLSTGGVSNLVWAQDRSLLVLGFDGYDPMLEEAWAEDLVGVHTGTGDCGILEDITVWGPELPEFRGTHMIWDPLGDRLLLRAPRTDIVQEFDMTTQTRAVLFDENDSDIPDLQVGHFILDPTPTYGLLMTAWPWAIASHDLTTGAQALLVTSSSDFEDMFSIHDLFGWDDAAGHAFLFADDGYQVMDTVSGDRVFVAR